MKMKSIVTAASVAIMLALWPTVAPAEDTSLTTDSISVPGSVIHAHSWSQCNESERRWCVRNTKTRRAEDKCVERERKRCCSNHNTRSGHNRGDCTSS